MDERRRFSWLRPRLCVSRKNIPLRRAPQSEEGKTKEGFLEIVVITNEYPPHIYGGAGAHVKYLSRELARLEDSRHELRVLCFGEQKEQAGLFSVDGVRVGFGFPFQDPRHQKFLETLDRNP